MVASSELIYLFILIALSGVFSATETALVAISRFKVNFYISKKRGGSAYLKRLKDSPHKMLSTLLICNNLVNILASVLATKVAMEFFETNPLAYATGIMTFLILVFGEIVPKSTATTHSSAIGLFMAPLIYYLSIILTPLIIIFDFITTKIFRVKLMQPRITEEEVRNIIDMAKEEGGIDKEEREMIHRIFKFDDIDVDSIKVPRTDMVAIENGSTLKQVVDLLKKSNFSRIPVYKGNKDKIVGIFYDKDALDYIRNKKLDVPVEKIMRKPLFVPETKKIDEMLKFFQKKRQQMAIIVDEHGGVSGLITLEDIMEEIVGEIEDETERVEPEFRKLDKKSYNVLGKTDIDDINQKLNLNLKADEDYDTLSGYILHKLGKIPKEGKEIDLKKATITIKKVEANRITEVIIRKK
jgi:CBS domain containing-hemolysin-like protein